MGLAYLGCPSFLRPGVVRRLGWRAPHPPRTPAHPVPGRARLMERRRLSPISRRRTGNRAAPPANTRSARLGPPAQARVRSARSRHACKPTVGSDQPSELAWHPAHTPNRTDRCFDLHRTTTTPALRNVGRAATTWNIERSPRVGAQLFVTVSHRPRCGSTDNRVTKAMPHNHPGYDIRSTVRPAPSSSSKSKRPHRRGRQVHCHPERTPLRRQRPRQLPARPVLHLANALPTRVLGDPLQSIFGFRGPPVDWGTVENDFPPLPELTTPWRWRTKNPELGEWLLSIRETLRDRRPLMIDDSAPVMVVPPREIETYLLGLGASKHSVVAIRKWEGDTHDVASRLGGAYAAIEAADCKSLTTIARRFTIGTGRARRSPGGTQISCPWRSLPALLPRMAVIGVNHGVSRSQRQRP